MKHLVIFAQLPEQFPGFLRRDTFCDSAAAPRQVALAISIVWRSSSLVRHNQTSSTSKDTVLNDSFQGFNNDNAQALNSFDLVEIDAAKVQIGRYSESTSQGVLNHTLPLMLKPDTGDDDLVITVR